MSYRENRDKEKLRKDKVAGYFFNLSQLTFAALVLGGISPIYTNNAIGYNWYILLMGLILTILLALIGNKLLKQVDMDMLGALFTVGVILSAGFLIWLYTKSGKKWLDQL